MTQLNNEDLLLDLYKIHAYIPNDANGNPLTPFGNFCAGYEAAKADSESILKQQQNTIAKLEAANQWLKDNPRTDIVEMYEVKINSLEAKNSELSASINVLREAMQLENFAADSWANAFYNAFQYIKNLRNGLSDFDSAIDNLNLCEKDCQLNWNKADAIKTLASTPALKGNEFPNSANLDIYNSVIFSDGSRGTMIMESKIVKWLCRNRAKDYFDEIVEGK